MTVYVIRAKYFGYNDEVFYVMGNRIANVFDNQAAADAACSFLQHYAPAAAPLAVPQWACTRCAMARGGR